MLIIWYDITHRSKWYIMVNTYLKVSKSILEKEVQNDF